MSKHPAISQIIKAAEELELIRPPFRTTAAVIAALGGQTAVIHLTGSTIPTVAKWNSEPHFPARYYAVMLDALHKRGFHAGPGLWGMATGASESELADEEETAPEAA